MKKRILIVDDDNAIISIFEFILKQANYETLSATTGKKCLEILKSNIKIDLIFLDLKMPEIAGFKIFEAIHNLSPTIPTIIMTGYSIENISNDAFNLGAYGIIYKPFDVEEVLSLVENIFNVRTPVL